MTSQDFPVEDLSYSNFFQTSDDDEQDFVSLQKQKPSVVESYAPHQYQPTYFELHNVVE